MTATGTAIDGGVAWLPWAIGFLIVLLLLVIIVTLVWAWRRHARGKETHTGEESGGDAMGPLRQALATVADLTGRGGDPREVPWLALIDLVGADGTRLLDAVDVSAGAAPMRLSGGEGVRFGRDGVVLHVGDVLAGDSGPAHWSRLVRLLRLLRPDQPLEGMVLTLPAATLTGPTALAAERLATLGTQASDLVWQAQRLTGLRLPLYVVLSDGQTLPGFTSLVAALPPEQRGVVLGWSSPYALNELFEPHWVNRGINAMVAGLSEVIVDASLDSRSNDDMRGMMLLPYALRGLEPHLTAFLSALLQPSAYHDAFLFRGFYLTGGQAGETVAFASGLFADKIFPERRLVHPLGGVVREQARKLRIVRAVAAVLAICWLPGLVYTWWDTSDDTASLTILVNQIDQDVRQAREMASGRVVDERREAVMREASRHILEAMGPMSVHTLVSLTAPISYFASPDVTIGDAITAGYNAVVIKEMGHRLGSLSRDMLKAPVGGSDMDEIDRLVDRLIDLRAHLRLYNDLPQTRSAQHLRQLATFTMGIRLGDDFVTNGRLYASALARARPFAEVASEAQVEAALVERIRAVLNNRYNAVPIQAALQRVSEAARGVINLPLGRDILTQVRDDLRFVQNSLGSAGYGWLNDTDGQLGGDVEALLVRIVAEQLAGKSAVALVRDYGLTRQTEARRKVRAMVRDGDMPLLKETAGRLALAADMATLADGLDQILLRPFMARSDGLDQVLMRSIITAPVQPVDRLADGRQPLVWDGQALTEVTTALTQYRSVLDHDMAKIPVGMQPAAKSAVRARFVRYAQDGLEHAALPAGIVVSSDEAALLGEVRGFSSVAPALIELRTGFQRFGLAELLQSLETTAGRQVRRLLTALDQARTAFVAFLPADPGFEWWDGSVPLAARAYGVTNQTDLSLVLASDRQSLANLAREAAEPLLAFLSGMPADGAPVSKWQEIVAAFKTYDQRDNAHNGLRNLEKLILVGIDRIDVTNCASLPAFDGASGDYFAGQAQIILDGLRARCGALGHVHVRDSYGKLRSAFNASLANRFPFAASRMPEAEPEEVRRFFQVFGRDLTADGLLASRIGGEVGRFLGDLDASRRVLAPMLADATLRLPLTYEVEAEFRTNPLADRGGAMIIEWRLELGDQAISSAVPGSKAVWTAGQPVRLLLRFARNGPKLPESAPGGAKVDGVTAIWEERGPWGLLALIAAQAPPMEDRLRLPDSAAETLRLEVPLRDNIDSAAGAAVSFDAAGVYLKLKLTAVTRVPAQPDLRAAVTLPRFPTAAPAEAYGTEAPTDLLDRLVARNRRQGNGR